MSVTQFVKLGNTQEIGVIRGTQLEVCERLDENRPGRCYAAMELDAAIELVSAAGYNVSFSRSWSGAPDEDEDAFIDRLASEWDMAQDARHDATSSHFGSD